VYKLLSQDHLPDFSDYDVLVVDDSSTVRRIIVRELNKFGINNIREAGNGEECLSVLQERPAHLVLLDLEMPKLDGWGVLQHLRASETLNDLSVIIISAKGEFDRTIQCIEIGAIDYLPKPFNPILLRARIYSCFEQHRLRILNQERLIAIDNEKKLLEIEQLKTEKLMLNILPRPIAERLKRGEKNISGSYPEVTIMFSDLIGFTEIASKLTATELVKLLNDLFTRFDIRAESLGLEKIKTIGDSYMVVGGLPIPRSDHAVICTNMALGMFEDIEKFNAANRLSLGMRIGLNSGPVVAGVIGFTKFSYDLWGNTVNTASRMESTSQPGRAQVSLATYELLKDEFDFDDGIMVECKGLGPIQTYLLKGKI
jgi:class 3 adenylate cyclase